MAAGFTLQEHYVAELALAPEIVGGTCSEEEDEIVFLQTAEEEAASAELDGVLVNKPSEIVKDDDDGEDGRTSRNSTVPPSLLLRVRNLQQGSSLFKNFGVPAVTQLMSSADFKRFGAGDTLSAQGEMQEWLGVIEAGTATVYVGSGDYDRGSSSRLMKPLERGRSDSKSRSTAQLQDDQIVGHLQAGGTLGELSVLGVSTIRTSTVKADTDGSMMLVHRSMLWKMLDMFPDERDLLESEAARWRAFLGSSLVACCPLHLGCQLRSKAFLRELRQGDKIVLDAGSYTHSAAIVEHGKVVAEQGGKQALLQEGAVAAEGAVLGLPSTSTGSSGGHSVTLECSKGTAQLALISRDIFWKTVEPNPGACHAASMLAQSKLPQADLALESCKVFQYFHSKEWDIWPSMHQLVRKRSFIPGEVIYSSNSFAKNTAFFIQHGNAEVQLNGHTIRRLQPGDCGNDLGFFGMSDMSDYSVKAIEFCVALCVDRDAVFNLPFSHVPVQMQEVRKFRHYYNDSTPARDDMMAQLQQDSIFGGCPQEFLTGLCERLEARVLMPGERIAARDGESGFLCFLLAGEATLHTPEGPMRADIGSIVGALGIASEAPPLHETLEAKGPCCVKVLHSSQLLDCFSRHPEAKRVFASRTRRQKEKLRRASNVGLDVADEQDTRQSVYNLPFFAGCSSKFLYLLDLHLENMLFFSGEVVVREGDESQDMYIVLTGRLEASVGGKVVGEIKDSSCFGETAVLGLAKRRTATIVARSLCDARRLSPKLFDMVMTELPHEKGKFEAMAAKRSRLTKARFAGGEIQQVVNFFSPGDFHLATALLDHTQDKLYRDGTDIMKKGEVGDWMLLLHQGTATASVDGSVIGGIKQGQMVGEMAALGLAPRRTADVTATCHVFAQELKDVLPLLEDYPVVKQGIKAIAGRRLEQHAAIESVSECNFEVLKDSPPAFQKFIDNSSQRRVFFQGDLVIKEETVGHHMILLLTGSVQIERHGQILGKLTAPSVLGELATLGLMAERTASLRALEVCDTRIVCRSAMLAALERYPEQMEMLEALAAGRMRRNVQQNADNILHTSQLFETCSQRFLKLISNHLTDFILLPGQHLCKEGEKGDSMYILLQGTLRVIIDGNFVHDLGPGSVVGEICLMGFSRVRTATLEAQEVCLVQELHSSVFKKNLAYYPRERAHLQQQGAARIASTKVRPEEDLFRQQALFCNCSAEFLSRLTLKLSRKIIDVQSDIVEQGAECNEMVVIFQGEAEVLVEQRVVCELVVGSGMFELNVLGVHQRSPVQVRASSLCQMQILHKKDLTELMLEFPDQRQMIMQTAARILRTDYAGISDLELISEARLLGSLPDEMVRSLAHAAEVNIAVDHETLREQGSGSFVMLLQGSAQVRSSGGLVRALRAGDSVGELALLGLQDESLDTRVVADELCLFLSLSPQAFASALEESDDEVKAATAQFRQDFEGEGSQPAGGAISLDDLLHRLGLRRPKLDSLQASCEEVAATAGQELLPSHLRKEIIVFVLQGKLQEEHGHGAKRSHGRGSAIAMRAVRGMAGPPLVAAEPSRALLLHRDRLAAAVRDMPTDEKGYVVSQLESSSVDHASTSENGETLREWAESMMRDKVQNAVERLGGRGRGAESDTLSQSKSPRTRARRRSLWSRPRAILKVGAALRRGPGNFKDKTGAASVSGSKSPRKRSKRSAASTGTQDSDWSSSPSPTRIVRVIPKPQEKLEVGLRSDLERLAADAREAADGARGSEQRLRREAAELRAQLAAFGADDRAGCGVGGYPPGGRARGPKDQARGTPRQRARPQRSFAFAPPPPEGIDEPEDEDELRRATAAAEQRVTRLRAQLAAAAQQRRQLLARLRDAAAVAL